MTSDERLPRTSVPVVLLTVAAYGVGLAMLGAACLVLVSLSSDLSTTTLSLPVSFHGTTSLIRISAVDATSGPVRLESLTGHANLDFVPPGRGFLAMTGLTLMALLGLLAWLLLQLRAVFDTLRRGTPFVADNARRIRRIAYAVIGTEMLRALVAFGWNRFASGHFTLDGWRFDTRPDVRLGPMVAGFVVLALSEVFRAGTKLDEDQSLTV